MTPELMGDILIYTLPWMTATITVMLTATGIYLNNKYYNNRLVQALVILDQVVMDVVKELNQSIVADLKVARADGKLTPDEAAQIKSHAVDLVFKRLQVDTIQLIQRSLGPISTIISTKIEAVILEHKKTKLKSLKSPGKPKNI